jgi:hypothetical protein
MNFLKNILAEKETAITSNDDFWHWFKSNAKDFYNVVKKNSDVDKNFLNKLMPKLNELREGFYCLTGIFDDETVELIITADGEIKNFVFVEELISSAPTMSDWKFTALKPELDIKDVCIDMSGYEYSKENLFFYSKNSLTHPDEINIVIQYKAFKEQDRSKIFSGICIFLDNYLGELNFATSIDELSVEGYDESKEDLILISELKSYLKWREKEFLEKYDGVRHNIESDKHSAMQAQLQNGNPMLAVINSDLLNWDAKASHPWIVNVKIDYSMNSQDNGLPDDKTYTFMEDIQNEISAELRDTDGYLNVGRQTGENIRQIYFACKEFRKPSKVLYNIQAKYSDAARIDYEVYKDKYWRTFEQFRTV